MEKRPDWKEFRKRMVGASGPFGGSWMNLELSMSTKLPYFNSEDAFGISLSQFLLQWKTNEDTHTFQYRGGCGVNISWKGT